MEDCRADASPSRGTEADGESRARSLTVWGRCRTSYGRQNNDGQDLGRAVDLRSRWDAHRVQMGHCRVGELDVGRAGAAAAANRGNLWVCGGWSETIVALVSR